jgi:hypothetical protein
MRLGRFTICLSDQWIDPIEYCQSDPDFPQNPPYCYILADHKAILTVNFDGVAVMSLSLFDSQVGMAYDDRANRFTREDWTLLYDFKRRFEALTVADVPSPEMAAQQAQLAATVTSKVETTLGQYQQGLYARVLNEMQQGSMKVMATELAGSRQLIDALVTLGLPRAVNSDEFLHAMLFGNQQLVTTNQIMNSYALSITQPITGVSLLVNPRLPLLQEADERTVVFSRMIDEYIDAITAETHAEEADYLANTRRMLELTARIIQVEVPVDPNDPNNPGDPNDPGTPLPGSAIHVFMPSVSRE